MDALLSHYSVIFPHFVVDGFYAVLTILALGGVSLLLPWVRNSLFRFAFPYLSVSAFVIIVEVLLRILPKPLFVIQAITCVFITLSIGGYLLIGKRLVSALKKPNLFLMVVLFVTLVGSFFLYNLTYQNGLHDEYYHHANIKLFFEAPTYPLLEPYRIGSKIDGYHVGLYFPVIALKAVTNLSVEKSLDIIKLSLFIPAPFVLSKLLAKYFSVSDFSSSVFIGVGFILGPSLLLFDSFSDNVLRGFSFPQLHTPILFEYAGLTWHGLTFFVVLSLLVQLSLVNEKDLLRNLLKKTPTSLSTFRNVLLLAIFSTLSLWLINRAFCLAFLVFGVITGVFYLFRLLSSRQRTVLYMLIGLFFTLLILAGAVGKNLPILRPLHSWGVVYLDLSISESAASRFAYASVNKLEFWKYLGFLGIGTITLAFFKKKLSNPWLFTILLLFPLWIYFARTPGADADDLAFTKLLRPLFLIVPLCLFTFSKEWKALPRAIIGAMLVLGFLSPFYFFLTSQFVGVQQDWIVSDPALRDVVEHIPSHTSVVGIQTNTQELQHRIANVLHAQVEVCYTACGRDSKVSYILENKEMPMEVTETRTKVFENMHYRLYR
ncbi:hypothetical protein KBD71_00290 [Candidatus Woesebacteria bacterium]|nr:hypothetical protein [Candidatus Woesebacteria bacterium]